MRPPKTGEILRVSSSPYSTFSARASISKCLLWWGDLVRVEKVYKRHPYWLVKVKVFREGEWVPCPIHVSGLILERVEPLEVFRQVL